MKIIVIGDPHHPYCDFELLEQIRKFNQLFKADEIVCTGDLTDQKFWSRFIKDPHDDGGSLEWEKTVKACKEMYKMFPKMTILNSNHDRRYIKKALEAGIIKQMIRPISEVIDCPKWKWHLGPNPLVLDNTAFMHGDELQGSVKAKVATLGMNVVQGHTHKAELQYLNTFNKKLFGLDVGCTVRPDSAAFDYAASSLTKVWTGFAYIDNGVPHLIPKKGDKK